MDIRTYNSKKPLIIPSGTSLLLCSVITGASKGSLGSRPSPYLRVLLHGGGQSKSRNGWPLPRN